jgi:hypothetical protein
MKLSITNHKTGEVELISRDVCTEHPQWVHEQCGTADEAELQAYLDQFNVMDWYGENGEHLGPDICGIELER